MLMLKWEVLEDAYVHLSDKADQPGGGMPSRKLDNCSAGLRRISEVTADTSRAQYNTARMRQSFCCM